MKYFLFTVVFACTAFSAAHAIEVTYAKDFCKSFEKHTPRADVEFKPGITIKGKSVAPADVDSATIYRFGDKDGNIKVPLSFDLAKRFGLEGFSDQELNTPLGLLEITQDGRVLKDGLDLTGQAQIVCKDNKKAEAKDSAHSNSDSK